MAKRRSNQVQRIALKPHARVGPELTSAQSEPDIQRSDESWQSGSTENWPSLLAAGLNVERDHGMKGSPASARTDHSHGAAQGLDTIFQADHTRAFT
jgi:hypothetical protein